MPSQPRRPMPFYVGVPAVASTLGLHEDTVRRWCKRARVRAIKFRRQIHYTDTKPRRADYLGEWRIEVESLLSMLTDLYSGEPVPRALVMRLQSLARGPGGESP